MAAKTNTTNMKFDELYWRDSVIKRVEIDRTKPGKQDTITFEIDWYDSGIGKLLFEDVYWMGIDMNFGIVADDCIDDAFISPAEDVDLIRFKGKWRGLIDTDLSCYVIKTSSTGSEFKIISKGYRLE